MWKISSLSQDAWTDYAHENTFQREEAGGTERLVIAPSGHPLTIARALIRQLSSPVLLLLVLHTPRGGSQAGRYQSPPLPLSEADDLLEKFASFFEQDARCDIWVHSADPPQTIVFERHNLIYAYGDLASFATHLVRAGMRRGEAHVPSPHAHNYHPEFDLSERELVASLPWSIGPLRPGDEQ